MTEVPEWIDNDTDNDDILPDTPVVLDTDEVADSELFGTMPVEANFRVEGTVGLV